MRNRKQVGIVGLLLELAHGMPGEHLLRALLVAKAGMHHRAQDRELTGDSGMFRQKLANLKSGNLRGDWVIWPFVFAPGEGLGIVRFEVAGAPDEPHDDYGCAFSLTGQSRLSAKSEQSRQRQATESGQAGAQEFTSPDRSGTMRLRAGDSRSHRSTYHH